MPSRWGNKSFLKAAEASGPASLQTQISLPQRSLFKRKIGLKKKKKRNKDWCFRYFVEFDLLITKVTFFVT